MPNIVWLAKKDTLMFHSVWKSQKVTYLDFDFDGVQNYEKKKCANKSAKQTIEKKDLVFQ